MTGTKSGTPAKSCCLLRLGSDTCLEALLHRAEVKSAEAGWLDLNWESKQVVERLLDHAC